MPTARNNNRFEAAIRSFFVFASKEGLVAADLNNVPDMPEARQLARAYDMMVDDLIRHVFQYRDIQYEPNSVGALSFANAPCPQRVATLPLHTQCISTVASVEVSIGPDEANPRSVATHLHFVIQYLVDVGYLQCYLDFVDPNAKVVIATGGGCQSS